MTTNQFFIKKSQIDSDGVVTLEGSDARHIRLVLRLKKGSRIRLVDEDRNSHLACIENVAEKAVTARIEKSSVPKRSESSEFPHGRVTIIQGIPRLPKADLIVQKLTELGVEGILFTPTERTPYRDGESRASARIERLRRIAESAAKQCSRSNIPDVGVCASLEAALESVGPDALMLVADESARAKTTGKSLRDNLQNSQNSRQKVDVAVFIGPEGGFSEDETEMLKDAGAKPFSLGRNILRTETAAIVAAALVLYEIGEI